MNRILRVFVLLVLAEVFIFLQFLVVVIYLTIFSLFLSICWQTFEILL